MNYDRDSQLIQPYYVIEEINRITKGAAIISTGVGQHQMWAAQYCDFRNPRLWLTSGSMGTMGFGLPAAIGAQFANPDKLVIDIDGDASIRMNIGEMETVTTYDLPVKVVVLNNNGDGMVKQWQKLFFKGRLSASDKSLHTKDFIKAAQADGFKYAVRLDKKADVPTRHRGIPRLQGRGIPRGDHRSGRRRVSHGRPGPALRGHDHRRLDPVAQEGGREASGCLGDVLTDLADGMAPMKYLHTMVRVTDVDASLKFYCDALGLEVVSRKDFPQGKFSLIFLAAPGDHSAQVELTHNWEPEPYDGGRNFGHLAYAVDDIYAACERLQKHGVTINRPPRDGRMAFVRSPDNISIELLQKDGALPPREPWVSMANTGNW